MASVSEQTFGQKYTKACAILEHLKAISGYQPANPTIAIPALQTFLDEVDEANNQVASQLVSLQSARAERLELYNGDDGLLKRARSIRDYLGSSTPKGKKLDHYIRVQRIVQQMTNYHPPKKITQPVVPDADKERTISTSERSFGSLIRAGKDILERIVKVGNYAPINIDLSVANFGLLVEKIESKNNEVASVLTSYTEAISKRMEIYEELNSRIQQIKLALASQYGKDAYEYLEVIKIRY